jgi:hypothetical protein
MTEEEEDTAFTDDEEETALTDEEDVAFADDEEETFEELLLVMPDGACPELDEWVPASPFLLLLEGRFPLEAGMTEEEETFSEDDDDFSTSSFADVPLSPPQAARATERIMDAIMLYLKFLILNLVHIPNFFIETI